MLLVQDNVVLRNSPELGYPASQIQVIHFQQLRASAIWEATVEQPLPVHPIVWKAKPGGKFPEVNVITCAG
jgi:hypothetical protein